MGLSFGWKAAEVRESIWRADTALQNVSEAALAAWREDGDASHLRPFATAGEPTEVIFRTLSPDESKIAGAYFAYADGGIDGYSRAVLICFRIGVDFKGLPAEMPDPEGTGGKFNRIVKEKGIRMLAEPFVTDIETRYPGMVAFYGGLILRASFATDVEKKASSPPSTPTPSSAAVSTAADTASPATPTPEAA